MEIGKTLYPTQREEWRDWLQRNFTKATEIWLVFPNKASGKPRLSYNDAVEEALCFGWIDSTVKRLDDARFMQKFTPRQEGSNWSAHNRRRAEELRPRAHREGHRTGRRNA